MLSVSCSRVFVCSLVSPQSVGPVGAEGGVPELAYLVTESVDCGVRGGPCEVALLFSANILSAVSFQFSSKKKVGVLLCDVVMLVQAILPDLDRNVQGGNMRQYPELRGLSAMLSDF